MSVFAQMNFVYALYRFDRSVLRWIPLKLIVVLVAITGIALTALLAVSFERERVLMEAIGDRDIRLEDLPDQTRFLLLVLAASATATSAAVILQHYKAVRTVTFWERDQQSYRRSDHLRSLRDLDPRQSRLCKTHGHLGGRCY